MTPKPTPSPADRLRELHAKTTPGEWTSKIEPAHYPECDDADLPVYVRGPNRVEIAFLMERYATSMVTQYEADGAFIAAAHNDLPALLSDHARLVEEIGRLRDQAEADRRELDDLRTFLLGAAKQMKARAALSPSQKEGGGNG